MAAWLLANDGIKALVGSRVYPQNLPPNPTYPALTYEKISGARHHDIGFAYPRYQLTCWGKTYGAARGLANTVILEIQRYKGYMGSVAVKQVKIENETDLYDSAADVRMIAVDVKIVHKEVG